MDPIDVRADTTFAQALRCVEFRLPKSVGLRGPGFLLALAVRYGMIGMAAGHHLLITADEDEEERIFATLEGWPMLVEDHVRWELMHRLPFAADSNFASLVGNISWLPLRAYFPLYRRMCPLSRSLDLVGRAIVEENRAMIVEGWPWLKRRLAIRSFAELLNESERYAMHFFERRQADIDEVREIALIGE